jgi:hypothetical protein
VTVWHGKFFIPVTVQLCHFAKQSLPMKIRQVWFVEPLKKRNGWYEGKNVFLELPKGNSIEKIVPYQFYNVSDRGDAVECGKKMIVFSGYTATN